MIALDTNILVYALDRDVGDRHDRTLQLVTHCLDAGSLFLPTQILADFASVAQRKLSLDSATVAAAIALVDRAQLSFWDALAVKVCDRVGVPVLPSEDLRDGLRCGRTMVVNPFLDANLGKLGL